MILYYLIFFFLIIRFAVTLFNYISNPKLTNSIRKHSDLVSILIPARNEEADIVWLLQSIEDQNYKNVEVVVLDDNSTDRTFEICKGFTSKDSRFSVIRGKDLPEGWLGKNYACYQLAKHAKGKYLLFLDADEIVKDGLINNAVNRMKIQKLSLLSLFSDQQMITLGEKCVVPLMHFLLLNLLPLRLIKLSSNPAFSAASGQFMMFDAKDYENQEWHLKVKDKIVEDIEIMKLVKRKGYFGEALLANGFISCRMYNSFSEAVHGFSKNLLAGFNTNVAALICYLLLVLLGPLFIAIYLNLSLLLFAVTLIILTRIMISLLSGQPVVMNILFHPIQMFSLLLISIVSIKNHFTKTITWKGRTIINEN
jgi:glycosyltransferase involved in cell wall biosynthesis